MMHDNLSRTVPPDAAAAAAAPHGLAWEHAAALARRRGLTRTVQALLREGLLDASQLVREGAAAWLPLWGQQALLRFEGLHVGRAGACRLDGAVGLYAGREPPRLIDSPSRLLACLAPVLGADAGALERLRGEIDNSVDNDTLCLAHRAGWGRALRRDAAGSASFLAWLRQGAVANPSLLLEQWGTLGHPWHPCHKTKLGLGADEVAALSPEFGARLALPLAALRADRARVETARPHDDYRRWFAARFGAAWDAWRAALATRGEDASRWLPLPLHPLQAARAVEEGAGALLAVPGVVMAATPTMSLRTVVPGGDAALPHVKLPVALRLTSVQRTLSPNSAAMGPRLTALLRRVLDAEAGFGGTLDVLGEEVGVCLDLPPGDDDRARHVSALWRENPMTRCGDGLFPYPVGALFADSPLDGRALAHELVRLGGEGPEGFLRRYLRVALPAVLGPYLLHGVAFEAHQQNSFMLLDARGRPRRLLLRDFGDLRVHLPTLRSRGLDLRAHRAGRTVFDDDAPVRDKLLHAAFLCHFAELALLLGADTPGLGEAAAWRLLADETAGAFERLRPRVEPARWAAERHAVLEADWPVKSFLRMRLADRADDVHGRMANPLRAAR